MVNKNRFFEKALKNAREMFSSKTKIVETLDSAMQKSIELDSDRGEIKGLTGRVKLFILMVRSYIKGEYRELPVRSLLLILAGLIYFINPFDLIGDFIPGVGYIDDVTVILWILKSVEDDVLSFQRHILSL